MPERLLPNGMVFLEKPPRGDIRKATNEILNDILKVFTPLEKRIANRAVGRKPQADLEDLY